VTRGIAIDTPDYGMFSRFPNCAASKNWAGPSMTSAAVAWHPVAGRVRGTGLRGRQRGWVYLPALDGVRALAVLAVVVSTATRRLLRQPPGRRPISWRRLTPITGTLLAGVAAVAFGVTAVPVAASEATTPSDDAPLVQAATDTSEEPAPDTEDGAPIKRPGRKPGKLPRVAFFGDSVACPGGTFTWTVQGIKARSDGLHFTPEGVKKVIAPWLLPQLKQLATTAG
jgi:hypothetical protein